MAAGRCHRLRPRLVAAQGRAAELAGASIRLQWPARRLLRKGSRVTGVTNGTEEIHAGITVVAAGAWSAAVLRTAQALDGLYAAVGHYADGVILGRSTGEVVRQRGVADGVGDAALARYDAAGFLSDFADAP